MIGFILLIVSILLKKILNIILFIYGFFRAITKWELNSYFRQLAIANDRSGNVIGQYLFNDILIKKGGYRFGNGKETISSVVGKNKVNKTFKSMGNVVDSTLNFLEKGHSIKAIDDKV